MPPIKTIIKLAFLSLVVGMVIVFFDITPLGFWEGALNISEQAFETLKSFIGWAMIYVVTGAFVVVPLYIISRFLKKPKQSRGSNER